MSRTGPIFDMIGNVRQNTILVHRQIMLRHSFVDKIKGIDCILVID